MKTCPISAPRFVFLRSCCESSNSHSATRTKQNRHQRDVQAASVVKTFSGNPLISNGRGIKNHPNPRRRVSADAVRRCTQNTLMLPCGSKTVGHTFDIDGHALPASRHRRSPRPSPHPRVMRASPCCTCVEILTLRCRGPMLAHALPGPRRRTRFWCYTLAWRVYGAALWLRPTPALR